MVRVGFRRAWAVTYLVVGAAGLVVAWPYDVWWQSGVFGAAVLLVAIGAYRLSRPYFEYDPASRTISVKVVPWAGPSRFGGTIASGMLRVRGRRIVCVRSDGRTRKVPIVRVMAEPGAWDAVVGALSEP